MRTRPRNAPGNAAAQPWLAALAEVMARVTANADRDGVLQALVAGAVDTFSAALARLWLFDPSDSALALSAGAGVSDALLGGRERLAVNDPTPLVMRAFLRRERVVVDPLTPATWPHGFDLVERHALRAYAAFPLLIGDRAVGAMAVALRTAMPAELIEALTVLAHQAALALDHVRVLAESHTLQAVAASITSERDPDILLQRLVAQTATALGADGCAVWLLDDTDFLVPAAQYGFSDALYRRLLALLRQPRPQVEGRGPWRTSFERLRDTRAPYFTLSERQRALEDGDKLAEAYADAGIVSAGRLPLFEPGGRVMGMLALYHCHERAYTESEVRLAQAFADQIAVAIHNAQLYDQTLVEARRTAALAQIAASLTVDQPMDEALTVVASQVVRATEATACAVLLIDPTDGRPRFAGTAGFPAGLMTEALALPEDATGLALRDQVLVQQEVQILRSFRQYLRDNPHYALLHHYLADTPWDTVVMLPLVFHGRTLGLLNAYYAGDVAPGEDEIALLRPIAAQAAVAVENARLFLEVGDKVALEERTRLAHDLHDSVTQTVFSLGMLARAAQTQHAQQSPKLGGTLDRVATLAQEALLEMRQLLFELRPASLADEGLIPALARLVEGVQTRTNMAIHYNPEAGIEVRLAPEVEGAVFRIVQEALGNAVKHAQASAATVSFAAAESGWLVTVRDNGVGFDPDAPVAPSPDGVRGGQGLRSMRERAGASGLALRVESTPERGTLLALHIPPHSARAGPVPVN